MLLAKRFDPLGLGISMAPNPLLRAGRLAPAFVLFTANEGLRQPNALGQTI
jgi:hypothetical protein